VSLVQSVSPALAPLDFETGHSRSLSLESVALLFQSIFQEDRLTPLTRVWLARLQMPLIRLALAQPTMFGNSSSPGIDLVSLIFACAAEGEDSSIPADALELEIQRLVLMIEHSASTGNDSFGEASTEFKAFLSHYRQPDEALHQVSSKVRQQEQRVALTVQYSVLLRRMLHGMPVRPELSNFLFNVWAQVLAVASVQHGQQHAQTLALKQAVTALIWATGAKKTRRNRARVIKDVPHLLQTLRAGMDFLGMPENEKNHHVTSVSAPMLDAFLDTQVPGTPTLSVSGDLTAPQGPRARPALHREAVRTPGLPGMEVIEDDPSPPDMHFWESIQAEQEGPVKPEEVTHSTWANPRGHRER